MITDRRSFLRFGALLGAGLVVPCRSYGVVPDSGSLLFFEPGVLDVFNPDGERPYFCGDLDAEVKLRVSGSQAGLVGVVLRQDSGKGVLVGLDDYGLVCRGLPAGLEYKDFGSDSFGFSAREGDGGLVVSSLGQRFVLPDEPYKLQIVGAGRPLVREVDSICLDGPGVSSAYTAVKDWGLY